MKTIKTVLAALVVFAAVFMVSCDKDETASNLTVNLLQKGTIKGYVYAELDLTSAGLENAPVGTQVILSVPYSQLNSSASGMWKDTVEVNAEGFFVAEVPTGNASVSVSIMPQPFEAIQIQELGSYEPEVRKIYTYGSMITKVSSGYSLTADQELIVELVYSDDDYIGYVEMAQISGKITAELNDEEFGSEDGPSGVTLVFHGSGWNKSVVTGTGGTFSLTVPANSRVYVDYSFTTSHRIFGASDWVNVPYLYENEYQQVGGDFGYDGIVVEDINIYTGYGNEVE